MKYSHYGHFAVGTLSGMNRSEQAIQIPFSINYFFSGFKPKVLIAVLK